MTMTNFSFSWVNKYSQELTICFWRQALHYMVHLIVWNHFQIPEKSFQSVHLWKPPLIQMLGTQMLFTWKFPESCLFGWNFETWKFVTSKCLPPLFALCLQTDISTKSQKGIFCSGLDTVPMRRPTSIAIFSLGPPASNKPLSKSWVPSLCGFFSSAPTINEMTSCHSGDDGSLESLKASRIMRQHFSVNFLDPSTTASETETLEDSQHPLQDLWDLHGPQSPAREVKQKVVKSQTSNWSGDTIESQFEVSISTWKATSQQLPTNPLLEHTQPLLQGQ